MTLMMERVGQDAPRRCDVRCYAAKHDDCQCICGGLNHAAGLKQAMINMRDVFGPVLKKRGIDLGKVAGRILADEARQIKLPLEGMA